MLKRIAIVSAGLGRAGLENVACGLAHGMKRCGLDVTLFSFIGGPLEADLRAAGIDVRVLADKKKNYTPNNFQSFKMILRLAYLLKSRMIQAINIHGKGAEKIAILASKIAGVKVRTFVFHNNYPQINPMHSDFDCKLIKRLKNYLLHVNHCIAISDKIMELAVQSEIVKPKDISVINNGIDLSNAKASAPKEKVRETLGFNDHDKLLIQVGRFTLQKNQDVSVRAVALVGDRFSNLHLLLAGNGPRLNAVKELANSLLVPDRIHFLGLRSDIGDLLGAADLFLLPSSYEGLPISLLEAFANGLPAVCTNVPGISDTVSLAPASAKLVDKRNEKELAAAIVDALEDRFWYSNAKRAGLQLVESHFSSDQMVERYIKLHEKLFII